MECDICGKQITSDSRISLTVGRDVYWACSTTCFRILQDLYKAEADALAKASPRDGLPLDQQRGWKMHRWWNQTYKRKKDVWAQFQVEREFKKIQRKARRQAR